MHFSPRLVTSLRLAAPPFRRRCFLRTAPSSRASSSSTSSNADDGIAGDGGRCVVSAAMRFLQGKKRLVDCLSPADYAHMDPAIGASVGGHLRHTLDHFSKCLQAAQQQPAPDEDAVPTTTPVTIRYDHRARGGNIETDPAAASRSISSLLQQLQSLPTARYLRAKRVAPMFMLGLGGDDNNSTKEYEFESNLERELFFCCHHGTHHDAMIQLILRGMGEKGENALSQAGEAFGVAPSTIDFLKKRHQK
ncbi:conserved unknown protein [Ectocarpus siliculosus]|uniref:Uncharacterized protein n=1 Tax=Ectocarpus siliculosus TaxID=2880 RepID=D7FP30_ECTSI|nr:conserved unknown protein [Ectocarpus siliculosus]|eukprot:CBJ30294.1 conserved unknown protein [Ectocarpus siliculosus]